MRTQWIGGKWTKRKGEGIPVLDPATEETLDVQARGDAADADAAAAAARAAFETWRWVSGVERATLLHEVARRIRAAEHELATLMTREGGKPLCENLDEIDWTAACFDYYAEIGRVGSPGTELEFAL